MLVVEFTVYPFEEGDALPGHVQVAIDAFTEAGLAVEVGALSNTVQGDPDPLLDALRTALLASVHAGATRIVVDLQIADR